MPTVQRRKRSSSPQHIMKLFKKLLVATAIGAAAGVAWYYLTQRMDSGTHSSSRWRKFDDFADTSLWNHTVRSEKAANGENTCPYTNSNHVKDEEGEEGFVPETPIQTKNVSPEGEPTADSVKAEKQPEGTEPSHKEDAAPEEPAASAEEEDKVVLPPLDDETREKFDM